MEVVAAVAAASAREAPAISVAPVIFWPKTSRAVIQRLPVLLAQTLTDASVDEVTLLDQA